MKCTPRRQPRDAGPAHAGTVLEQDGGVSAFYSISHSGMALFDEPIESETGLTIDLVSAPLAPGHHELSVRTSFGGIEIYLPRHVKFTVESERRHGGYEVHEGHGALNRIGRTLRKWLGVRSRIPDRAVDADDPSQPTTLHLVIEGRWGGVDVYRI
jgi:hypothetical protein